MQKQTVIRRPLSFPTESCFPFQLYSGCSFPYTCQVPNETSTDRWTDEQTDRRMDRRTDGWTDGRTDGWTAAGLDRTAKCQRTPHACSKFIVTKADEGRGTQNQEGKAKTKTAASLGIAKII